MKEKPILFNTEMVKAILDGRKTQTRRIMDYPKNFIWNSDIFKKQYSFDTMFFNDRKNQNVAIFKSDDEQGVFTEWFKCPYEKGMKLWVKETYEILEYNSLLKTVGIKYIADNKINNDIQLTNKEWDKYKKWKKKIGIKSSLYMFRSFARIWLEITDVRVGRIKDISEDDSRSEGIKLITEDESYEYSENPDYSICRNCGGSGLYNTVGVSLGVITDCDCMECNTHKGLFKNLWNNINESRGYGWDVNPYVWIIKFKRIQP